MVNFLGVFSLALLLILSPIASATNIPNGIPSFATGYDPAASVASMTVDPSGVRKFITLNSGSDNPTSNNLYRLVKMGQQGTSLENYQVTSGSTLYCSGFYYESNGTTGLGFGYGTAAVTNDNASAPANDRYYANSSGASLQLATTAAVFKWVPVTMSFPSASFPYLKITISTIIVHVMLSCQELGN